MPLVRDTDIVIAYALDAAEIEATFGSFPSVDTTSLVTLWVDMAVVMAEGYTLTVNRPQSQQHITVYVRDSLCQPDVTEWCTVLAEEAAEMACLPHKVMAACTLALVTFRCSTLMSEDFAWRANLGQPHVNLAQLDWQAAQLFAAPVYPEVVAFAAIIRSANRPMSPHLQYLVNRVA